MTKAIRIHANGGPEVLRWEEVALPPPGAGEARVRHTAIGINYSDVNVRRGGDQLPSDAATLVGAGLAVYGARCDGEAKR